MTTLFEESTCRERRRRRSLTEAFRPVAGEMRAVEGLLASILSPTRHSVLASILASLRETRGKRLRPALVLLSAAAAGRRSNGTPPSEDVSIRLAAAVELIHVASLVHDDLIDGALTRHGRPSVPARWGPEASVALGDLLCAKAFRLIADCEDPHLFAILGSELSAMCEGELRQVADRDDFEISERHCLDVVEKKTASLFGACCQAGARVVTGEPGVGAALQQFGFHLGVVFQILDDCTDLLGARADLGKEPGQDWRAGDVTLPLLYGMRYGDTPEGVASPERRDRASARQLSRLHDAFRASEAPARLLRLMDSHVSRGKRHLQTLAASPGRDSLQQLADVITASMTDILSR